MTDAERLRLRCRQSPAWAAAEIERLRAVPTAAGAYYEACRVVDRDVTLGMGDGGILDNILQALAKFGGIEPADGHTGSDTAG